MQPRRPIARFALVFALLFAVAAAPALAKDALRYPETRKVDVVDDYHGTSVADPYRWLEEDVRENDSVRSWVEAQNVVTFGYLEKLPGREKIRKRLEQLTDYARYNSPSKVAGRYFWFKNDGLQNQSVLYVGDSPDAAGTVLMDPNTWSEDGTVALAGMAFSENGRWLAYGKSASGSDWRTWHVRDLMQGKDLADRLDWVKFSGASFTKDGEGFFYSRFDAPDEGAEFQALNTGQKVYYHRVGTAQSEDVLAYARPDHPDWLLSARVSEDGRWLVLSAFTGKQKGNRIWLRDLTEPYAMPVPICTTFEHSMNFVGNDGSTTYFRTDRDAPNGTLVSIDVSDPSAPWKTVLAESEFPLKSVSMKGDRFYARYLEDVIATYRVYDVSGAHQRDVALPGSGSTSGFGGRRDEPETFFTYSSFNSPPSIYRYDTRTHESALWKRADVSFDAEDYEVRQVFYRSKDGTRVPMFVAHKKGLKLDGHNPTLLFGYGGFNVSLSPRFSASRLAWMEMGGVFALANLRGGGEYGEAWHKAGTKTDKQNVFDDFIAAAEWLIDQKITSPSKLAIQGGSNGGLLVGAAITQRPDLFGAALPAVGVMDMLRFHRFTAGRFWINDYGSSDDPEQFTALHAYSPYHNLKKGTSYPATLITTADTDDRVVPGHSFKFAAALQAAHAGPAPVLIRIETKAGHGGGKPISKRIEETADQWAFLAHELGMKGASGGKPRGRGNE